MTAEQLEELLSLFNGAEFKDRLTAQELLQGMGPSLARRVIAAEKLVEALCEIAGMDTMGASAIAYNSLIAYREASK